MSGRLKRLLRGLLVPGSIRSREQERWCAADPFPSGSYNFQFLRSRAEGDFVRHPDLLWSPNPYWTARAGLNAHVRELADRLGGAVYSDALIVLHPSDFARTERSMLESWKGAAQQELADCFERLVDSQGFTRAMPGRPFRLEVVRDGDPLLGVDLRLGPREFATAMLPNLYLGPGEGSVPLVEVFVSGGDGRFASAGTLYSDQLAFSVGAHALDNHTIEALDDSALYTVHRFPDQPGLHHKLNGERADRLVLETGSAHGGQTVRIVDPGRDKLLLEVMLVAASALEAELPVPGERAGRLAGVPRPLSDLPFSPLPGGPAAGTILPEDVDLGSFGAFSIIPDALPERIHTLSERATLLQRVHFDKVMSGYSMELDRGGQLSPRAAEPVARFEVRGDRVSVVARARDLSVDGRPAREGESTLLAGAAHALTWRGGELEYRSLRRKDRRWPYLARVSSPRRSTPLAAGDRYTIGRDHSGCDVPLPDRMTTLNILWKGDADAETVEVRSGSVPRSRFRTDAILVASTAAEVDLSGAAPLLRNPSSSCPLHVLRASGETVHVRQGAEVELASGDELLIGNQAFALLAPGETERPSPASHPGVSAADGTGAAGGERAGRSGSPDPLPDRLQEGPGSRGRRPRVGGGAGRLVEPSRTFGAVLGISPAAERSVPASSQPPAPTTTPAQATTRQTAVPTPAPATSAQPDLPTPADRSLGELDSVDDLRIPTRFAPSLSLDPTFEGSVPHISAQGVDDSDTWLRGGWDEAELDSVLTIIDDNPDWAAIMAQAAETATRHQQAAPATAVVEVIPTEPRVRPVAVGPAPSVAEAAPPPADPGPRAVQPALPGPAPQPAATEAPSEPPTVAEPHRVVRPLLPRGLRIPSSPRVAPLAQGRRAAPSLASNLPTFGPLPARRRGAPTVTPAPSFQGD